MMALLYETVTAFKDTWIECLGDLGRYRMAIEDDDIRDREVWSGVARHWYGKAADNSPTTGRLYHHLAILARPYTLQQLSFYTRSLTCIQPFESARGSIMTLFNPILDGKESAYHRSSSMETIFIKAHAILFTRRSLDEFNLNLQQLLCGLFESYIGKMGAKFKENGVFAALSNISSLFEYGILGADGDSRAIFRLAYDEARALKAMKAEQVAKNASEESREAREPAATSEPTQLPTKTVESLTSQELEASLATLAQAASLTFGTFSTALRCVGDKNICPMIHVYLVFLLSLTSVEKAMRHVEKKVPWIDLAAFLNSLAGPGKWTSKVMDSRFPKPDEGIGRPLPEDFVMRGHLWSESHFPDTWFEDAMIDDEERILELPSMAAPRAERLRWLGHRLEKRSKWLHYDHESRIFVAEQPTDELPIPVVETPVISSWSSSEYKDISMTDVDDIEESSQQILDSPPKARESVLEVPKSPRTVLKREPSDKARIDMRAEGVANYEKASPPLKAMNLYSAEWLDTEKLLHAPSLAKIDIDPYPSNLQQKMDYINPLDGEDYKSPTEV